MSVSITVYGTHPGPVNPRVLFVDDSADEQELFPIRFGSRFSEVVTVGSVTAALDVLEKGRTDIVFTDLALPGDNGLDLVRWMRASAPELGGMIPAVAVTGLGASDDLARAYEAGFSGYLVKPYESDELLSVVDRVRPSIDALRGVRDRARRQRDEQRVLRLRLVERRRSVREQRARLAIKYGTPEEREAARLECVRAAARSFAQTHFVKPVDELEVVATRTLEDGLSSWVVVALCAGSALLVEVLDGRGVEFVARRFDA